jgi:hypothetical protein
MKYAVAGIERTDAFASSIAHRLDRGSIDPIRPRDRSLDPTNIIGSFATEALLVISV